jgi:hypothetical protein
VQIFAMNIPVRLHNANHAKCALAKENLDALHGAIDSPAS